MVRYNNIIHRLGAKDNDLNFFLTSATTGR